MPSRQAISTATSIPVMGAGKKTVESSCSIYIGQLTLPNMGMSLSEQITDEFLTSPKSNSPEAFILKHMDALKSMCEAWKSSEKLPELNKKNFPFLDHKSADNHAYFAQALCKMLKQYATQAAASEAAITTGNT